MIDAQSNFMLLMSLMELTPAEVAADLGTDVTMISRWRTGQRRLVPGRSWGPKVAAYLVAADGAHGAPVLRTVLQALYPEKPTETDADLMACTLQFLYCPGQMSLSYRQHRYNALKDVLPGQLAAPVGPEEEPDPEGAWVQGMLKTQSSIMEYLTAFLRPGQAPDRMILVSPDGLNPIFRIDERFAGKFMERLQQAFAAGHRMTMVVHPNYRLNGSDGLLARFEGMHLRGSIETKVCKEFERNDAFNETLLLSSRDKVCVSVTLPEGEPNLSKSLLVKSSVTCAKTHLMAMRLASLGAEEYLHELFEKPNDFFVGLRARAAELDGAYYYMSDAPFFGVMDLDELCAVYELSDDERALVGAQFDFLTLRPREMRGARVRYVMCRDEIERALVTDELWCVDLSRMLGRAVRLNRAGVLALLRALLDAMQQSRALELALLPRHIMDMVGMHAHIMDGVFALGSAPDGHTTATKDPQRLVWCLRYASMVWHHIPPGMKRRSANEKILRGLVEQYEKVEE